ncbi:Uncharacterized conserved protein, DUF1800 family [Paenibacillus sp. yr247]|uniref:DUF1800 domain-containing protein n=1 Tax=Paenibacillus sp. yr247 TaxID=1761880 RepID=UPI0008867E32|nr:DUF1800 domain-containing protein [Paenibacillus sp. yr247]SDN25788.1 Uncharacterized conserved protein, DUF1800 family [Paenibacillus sp. yr247]
MGAPWTNKEAIHLLQRAGFGSTEEEVSACVSLGREETVRRLITGEGLIHNISALNPFDQMTADGKKSLDPLQLADQQMYWLYRMVYSDAPLIEKMTLFWHGHFATANYKVNDVTLMVQQNTLLRNYALGNFKELVLAIGKDPAMMIWLDVNRNKKSKPNENYAREVMELFTLGIGQYTETDVKEAARAFTGWTYDKKENKVGYNSKQHDNDSKILLGEKGNLDSDDAVDIIFHQKSLSTFLATKLLKYFATDTPAESWIQKVAEHIVEKATIGEVLQELFLSDDFYDEKLRLSLIKSPAEYVAGILKSSKLTVSKGHAQAMRRMGQELYSPPDVAGWRGGASWLNTNSLLSRYQFAETIAKQINGKLFTSPDYTPEQTDRSEEWVKLWSQRLGISDLSDKTLQGLSAYVEDTIVHTKQKSAGLRGLFQLVLISPEAQMK